MKTLGKKPFSILLLLFLCNAGYSQTDEIKIRFIGNCGLHLTDGSTDLYIDFPYKSGAHGYMKYDKAELDSIGDNGLFLFTHRHADHYSKKILKQFKTRRNKSVFGNWNTKQLQQLNGSIDDFEIQSFKTRHRFSLKHYSYLITWHGKKLYLSGDTESAERIGEMKGLDWAFVPYWILLDAKDKEIKIDTKMFGVYHLYPNQKFKNQAPEKIKVMDKQGEVISVHY